MNHKKAISPETVQYIVDNSASKSIDCLIKDTGLSEYIVSRVIRDTIGKKPVTPKFRGCNEDCFNCRYKDCYRPAQKMTDDVQGYFKAEKQREKRIRDILDGKITWDGKTA